MPCCFYFQTSSCCFLNGTNSMAKSQINSTVNIADSAKISFWKFPLIYFQVFMEFQSEGLSCYQCQEQKLSSSTHQKGWH